MSGMMRWKGKLVTASKAKTWRTNLTSISPLFQRLSTRAPKECILKPKRRDKKGFKIHSSLGSSSSSLFRPITGRREEEPIEQASRCRWGKRMVVLAFGPTTYRSSAENLLDEEVFGLPGRCFYYLARQIPKTCPLHQSSQPLVS